MERIIVHKYKIARVTVTMQLVTAYMLLSMCIRGLLTFIFTLLSDASIVVLPGSELMSSLTAMKAGNAHESCLSHVITMK